MTNILLNALVLAASLTQTVEVFSGSVEERRPVMRITIVFNNVPYQPGLKTAWGFSALIQGLSKTILFDTGSDGAVLLSNMKQLELDPKSIDTIVLSHSHADHTGGIAQLLAANSDVDIVLTGGFTASFRQQAKAAGARVHVMKESARLLGNVYSSGELDHGVPEQALILDTPKGSVVITGCAHPGIDRIVETATRLTGRKIHLALGGFHLFGKNPGEIESIIRRLKALGVEKVAPSHCTGERAIALFRRAWRKDFVEGGLGARIELALE